jgi:2-polyprenyl-3-methyl-5-hydroxy-6-metoxy-1,4-benzoquinol methylase
VPASPARIVLLLFDCRTPSALVDLVEGLPQRVTLGVEELVLMQEGEPRFPSAREEEAARARKVQLRFHRNPRPYDFGAARKAGFEYALREGFDHIIVMRGNGTHPPRALPEMIDAALAHPTEVILGARAAHLREAAERPGSIDRLARVFTRRVLESVLSLGLRDYLSGFRIYPARALRCVPYQLDADGPTFDTELLIQFRAVGVPLREHPIESDWRESEGTRAGLRRNLANARAAVGYRLHQLHVTRHGQYIIDHGVHYTLKQSSTGSHMQIVESVSRGSVVLDLGCSQGLLARPLKEKQVLVTGVDAREPGDTARDLEAYFQRDLDQALELPVGRAFDYVVVADVIEHIRHREQLLRGSRRYLKQGGRLIISTGNVALWFYRLSLVAGRFEYGPRGILDRTHVHLFTRATFRREIERAGFHILEERVTALPFEVVFESTGRSGLVRALARAYHLMARLWPEMFAYQFIFEAEIETLDDEATQSPEPRVMDGS